MIELYLRRWNAMMLHIRWYMLMMRKGRGKRGITGVWKIIIPIQAFFAPVNFMSVRSDQAGLKVQFFSQPQANTV